MACGSLRREVVLLRGGETWVCRSSRETICDGDDDNGNGPAHEGCDDDGDGWCHAGLILQGAPAVCPFGGSDCDDGNDGVHPDAGDIPGDSLDQDCNGVALCDPARTWRSHGEFVVCVVREFHGLVREGRLEPGDCAGLIREAARSAVGRLRTCLLSLPAPPASRPRGPTRADIHHGWPGSSKPCARHRSPGR